jgi:hypothetical protein
MSTALGPRPEIVLSETSVPVVAPATVTAWLVIPSTVLRSTSAAESRT